MLSQHQIFESYYNYSLPLPFETKEEIHDHNEKLKVNSQFPEETNNLFHVSVQEFLFVDLEKLIKENKKQTNCFSFVLNLEGVLLYGFCYRTFVNSQTTAHCDVFLTYYPLASFFYQVLEVVSLLGQSSDESLQLFLTDLSQIPIPVRGETIEIVLPIKQNVCERENENENGNGNKNGNQKPKKSRLNLLEFLLNKDPIKKKKKKKMRMRLKKKRRKSLKEKIEQDPDRLYQNTEDENKQLFQSGEELETEKEKLKKKKIKEKKQKKKSTNIEKKKNKNKKEQKEENGMKKTATQENPKQNEWELVETVKQEGLMVVSNEKKQEFTFTNPIYRVSSQIWERLLMIFDNSQLVQIFSSILLERRILFVSQDISFLTSSILAFLSLLVPFSWRQIFVLLIPKKLIEMLIAPIPFIIGCPKAFLNLVDQENDDNMVIIDLESGSIQDPFKDHLKLPPNEKTFLLHSINKITQHLKNPFGQILEKSKKKTIQINKLVKTKKNKILNITKNKIGKINKNKSSNNNDASEDDNEGDDNNDEDDDEEGGDNKNNFTFKKKKNRKKKKKKKNLKILVHSKGISKIHTTFLEFFSKIFQNYSNYFTFDSLVGSFIFDFDFFLKESKNSNQEFLKHFRKTQMFECWFREREEILHYEKNSKSINGEFEIKLIEKKQNRLSKHVVQNISNLFSKINIKEKNLINQSNGNVGVNNQERGQTGNKEKDKNLKLSSSSSSHNLSIESNLLNTEIKSKWEKIDLKLKELINNEPKNSLLQILQEFWKAETIYYANLQIINDEFLHQITEQSLIAHQYITSIFGNISNIFSMQKKICKILQKIILNWDENSTISSFFLKIEEHLENYLSYISSHQTMLIGYKDVMKQNKFRNYVIKKKKKYQGDDLYRFLVLPMSHFRTYFSTLQKCIRSSKKNLEEKERLQIILQNLKELDVKIKNRQKTIEHSLKLLEIERELANKIPLISKNKKFIFDEDLMKICENGMVRKHFYLFSDLLIYSHAKVMSRKNPQMLRLRGMSVQVAEEDMYPNNSFLIKTPKESFCVVAFSSESQKKWVYKLNELINLLQENINETNDLDQESTNNKNSNSQNDNNNNNQKHAAILIPKDQINACMICKAQFKKIGLSRKKYNCKNCGKVCCYKCSKKKYSLPSISKDRSRVCNECFNKLSTNESKWKQKQQNLKKLINIKKIKNIKIKKK
ncbi:receptor mediated endocytosis [Anaeramoeba flamelloides]|uniref:Receptor mediated endocytosis n=1 Tax=Anaeramoeba flamelloides TaxID=1746091 RepID=A0AAV7YJP7_9EUKA|nr:receptor mediated endocytosis [Anaeramoeba flamelloides]